MSVIHDKVTEADVNRYLDGVPKYKQLLPDAVLFHRFGVKVERRVNSRFSWYEYHVTLFYPNRAKRRYSVNYDEVVMAKRALLVVFGKVPYLTGGWHARGGPVLVYPQRIPFEKELGYKNPTRLANY